MKNRALDRVPSNTGGLHIWISLVAIVVGGLLVVPVVGLLVGLLVWVPEVPGVDWFVVEGGGVFCCVSGSWLEPAWLRVFGAVVMWGGA